MILFYPPPYFYRAHKQIVAFYINVNQRLDGMKKGEYMEISLLGIPASGG